MDAIATPFVQGRLRGEKMTFTIRTECAHCSRPIGIEMDSDLAYRVEEEEAAPLVFSPKVDFARMSEPSIIDVF